MKPILIFFYKSIYLKILDVCNIKYKSRVASETLDLII